MIFFKWMGPKAFHYFETVLPYIGIICSKFLIECSVKTSCSSITDYSVFDNILEHISVMSDENTDVLYMYTNQEGHIQMTSNLFPVV